MSVDIGLKGQPVWTIVRRGNRLTLAEEGDPEAIVLEPESADTFYTNAIDGPVRFERDDSGHIVAMRTLRWPGRFLRVDFTDRGAAVGPRPGLPPGLTQTWPKPAPSLALLE